MENIREPPLYHRFSRSLWEERMDRLYSLLPPFHELHHDPFPMSFTINLNKPDDPFKVMLNVKQFQPDQIVVKAVDGDKFIVVHCKHEEGVDAHGLVSREFTRRYKIPEDVESSKLTASISMNGVLTIEAPRKIAPLPEKEQIIPNQPSAAVEEAKIIREHSQPSEENK